MIEWIVLSGILGASISGGAVWCYHRTLQEESKNEKNKLEKEIKELRKQMTTERERVLRYVPELIEHIPSWNYISPSCYEMELHGYTYQIEKQTDNCRIRITIKREDVLITKVKYLEAAGKIHMIFLETERKNSGIPHVMAIHDSTLHKAVREVEKRFPTHQEIVQIEPTIKKEEILSSIPELEKIKRMISYIKKHQGWFAEEELFCVEELWENDIEKMKQVYEEVSEQNKEQAKEVFLEGLLVLQKKIEELIQTGDMRKMKEIKKQVRVVEERDA